MSELIEVNNEKCGEVDNCKGIQIINGKTYCEGCGSVYAEFAERVKNECKDMVRSNV